MRRWAMAAALLLLVACGQGGGHAADPASSLHRPSPTPAARPTPSPAHHSTGSHSPAPAGESDVESNAAADEPAEPTPTGDSRHAATDGPVSVTVEPPEGWERTDEPHVAAAGGGQGDVYLNGAACEDGFCAHLHVTVLPGAVGSLEAYHVRSKHEVEQVLDAEVLAEEPVTVDGEDGYELTYRVDDDEGTLRYRQRYALVDDRVVVATFAATSRLLDQWRDDADALLESITVVAGG